MDGTIRDPSLVVRIPPGARHAQNPSEPLLTWLRNLPDVRFDGDQAAWIVRGTGANAQARFDAAGVAVAGLDTGEFAGVTTIDALYAPVTLLSEDDRTVLVRHRFAGYEQTLAMIGPAATWDKSRRLFRLPVADVIAAGVPLPGVLWDTAAIDRAYALHARTPLVPGLEAASARLGSAIDRTAVENDVRAVASKVGHYPEWWGMPPMAHQIPGALAVAAGHTLLADEPGIGKTVSVLLAAAISGAERLFITCPPVVATHWSREVARTGFTDAEHIVVIRAGAKPPSFDDAKVVVAPDSMLVSRPALGAQVAAWGPDWLIVDEAHRMKNSTSKRSAALLDIAAMLPEARTVAMTGTPVMSGPQELVPLLEFTGHLAPVFGGASAFLSRYCRQDKYGTWHANKRRSGELHRKLVEQVWVRRTKEQVLPNLPDVTVERIELPVNLADYRKTHAEVIEAIDTWIAGIYDTYGRQPSDDEVQVLCDESIRYVSWLRRAAGVSKVPMVAEMVREHIAATSTEDGSPMRPMLLWAHHGDVIDALVAALPGTPVIRGETSRQVSTDLIDQFQAGTLPVLICSITAVGAGVTLTRGSDMIFAEMDWTPAMMQQAVDRCRRIGQKNAITARIAVAIGTLDEHQVKVLGEKGEIVGAVLGDSGAAVFAEGASDDALTPTKIIRQIIADRLTVALHARPRSAHAGA